jgi:hypothetical protein
MFPPEDISELRRVLPRPTFHCLSTCKLTLLRTGRPRTSTN